MKITYAEIKFDVEIHGGRGVVCQTFPVPTREENLQRQLADTFLQGLELILGLARRLEADL